MNEERLAEDIITTFLLNTCRLRPQLTRPAVEAAMHCALAAGQGPRDEQEADLIPLITGSVAEFYIEPMLRHIGDVDVMLHRSTQLAIPRGQRRSSFNKNKIKIFFLSHSILHHNTSGNAATNLQYLYGGQN